MKNTEQKWTHGYKVIKQKGGCKREEGEHTDEVGGED